MERTRNGQANPPANRAGIGVMPPNNRSRLGNGSILPSGVDGRSNAARRWKEIYCDSMCQTAGRHEQLCRALASLVIQREGLDLAIMRGEAVDLDHLMRLSGEIRRVMARAGIDADDEPADATAAAIAHLRGEAAA